MKRSADRWLFLSAAILTAASLALPLWDFRMSAPQYPDEALHIRVTRAGLAGDLQEVDTLQQYVGVRFPTDLPELDWVTRAIAILAALLALGAAVRRGMAATAIRIATAALLLAFLVASLVTLQARLYQVGHERDADAPITAVKDFTPPAIGPAKVGNFTVWSYPHLGAIVLSLAAALAVVGASRPLRVGRSGRRQKRFHAQEVVL